MSTLTLVLLTLSLHTSGNEPFNNQNYGAISNASQTQADIDKLADLDKEVETLRQERAGLV